MYSNRKTKKSDIMIIFLIKWCNFGQWRKLIERFHYLLYCLKSLLPSIVCTFFNFIISNKWQIFLIQPKNKKCQSFSYTPLWILGDLWSHDLITTVIKVKFCCPFKLLSSHLWPEGKFFRYIYKMNNIFNSM